MGYMVFGSLMGRFVVRYHEETFGVLCCSDGQGAWGYNWMRGSVSKNILNTRGSVEWLANIFVCCNIRYVISVDLIYGLQFRYTYTR